MAVSVYLSINSIMYVVMYTSDSISLCVAEFVQLLSRWKKKGKGNSNKNAQPWKHVYRDTDACVLCEAVVLFSTTPHRLVVSLVAWWPVACRPWKCTFYTFAERKKNKIRQNKSTYQECVTYQHLLYKCLIFMCTWLCISENCATDSAVVLSSSI